VTGWILPWELADFVVARSGAATVSEVAGLGIPSVFVPYPVGNGEQELNARDLVSVGGAILCRDAEFTGEVGSRTHSSHCWQMSNDAEQWQIRRRRSEFATGLSD